VELLDAETLRRMFQSPSMDFALANRLKAVSRLFLALAEEFERKLTQVDLKTVCNNPVFQDAILRRILTRSPRLRSLQNVQVVGGGSLVLSETLSLTNTVHLHFHVFKLDQHSFSCLLKLPKLRSLEIKCIYTDSGLIDFEEDLASPKLKLHHLKLQFAFVNFLAFCDPTELKSAELFVLLGIENVCVEEVCSYLLLCCKLQKLTITTTHLCPAACLNRLYDVVRSMHNLTDFSLRSGCDDWTLVSSKRLFKHLTTIKLYSKLNLEDHMLLLGKCINLRYAFYSPKAINASAIILKLKFPASVTKIFNRQTFFCHYNGFKVYCFMAHKSER